MSDARRFDVPDEPSVASEDPNERKLARRLRIQRRLEALKKHDGAEDVGIVESSLTERQIETSAELLEKLIAEGDEVITNVRVANDAREVHRRDEDVAIRNGLLRNLEAEAAESLEKYRAINARWSDILASKDPLDIHAAIRVQSTRCADILERKDSIIAELKLELKNADEKFVADSRKQCEDVNLLIERIEHQVDTIANAYRRELVLIEDALDSERGAFLASVARRWDALYRQRHEEDVNGVDRRKEIMTEYDKEMRRIRIEHQEMYRVRKIELETECQNLQLEVERMKAVCMMNVEKLDYSYAVLKRREDENAIIRSQQKRRLNKLQDIVNELKKNYKELEENTRLDVQRLTEQVLKARKNISELEVKSSHFAAVNEKQYFDIWDMNTKNADELVEKIMTADRIIHEQTLGLDWEPPELPLLRKEDLPSYSSAKIAKLQQIKADADANVKIFDPRKIPSTLENMNLERRLLNHIVKQISDHTGFLIEDRLRDLLAPHAFHDNIIIRLDNVFQALSIKSEDQVDLLLNFFLPYAYCASCSMEEESGSIVSATREEISNEDQQARIVSSRGSRSQEESADENQDERNFREISEAVGCQLDNGSSGENSLPSDENESADAPRNPESRVTSAPGGSSVGTSTLPGRNVTCKRGHLLQIESANVTRALKEFVEKCHASSQNQSFQDKLAKDKVSLSRGLSSEDVTRYWSRYREIFSPKKEKLWDGLSIGLHKYHEILKERQRLDNETDCLRRQNEELRRLLETYMTKPVDTLAPLGPRSSNKTA